MTIISVLTKTGEHKKTEVAESVQDVWLQFNCVKQDPNNDMEFTHRDFLYLTDKKGNKVIYNKRYVFTITEE